MNEDKLIIAMAEDKADQCQENYMITNTGFLDMRQQTLCKNTVTKNPGAKGFFYGGYPDAERRIAVFIPDYIEAATEKDLHEYFLKNKEESPLALIRARHNGYKPLSHRDYLGSLTGLGIKRDAIGDILVSKDGADILILREMHDFLLANYGKAGRTYLELTAEELDQLILPEGQVSEKSGTVASLRLDNVVAAAFGMSRSNAAEAIKSGSVFVNNLQTAKNEKLVREGDKIVWRGKGKVVLKDIGGNTRKDRIYITFMVMR
ncbi:YlmH family RNA-binding protein [Aminipila luticellarii]|uniref:RNA-binding protein n=1 Tax=Aminipila luticellarii TaxID=2507160 RepID=A0A410PYE6_9FIRM|nr:YlmH/Sll1252 family protein [Aminipila luticellarii]QAT43979.1 RNA-binding protein [Aminipila luticellarii]